MTVLEMVNSIGHPHKILQTLRIQLILTKMAAMTTLRTMITTMTMSRTQTTIVHTHLINHQDLRGYQTAQPILMEMVAEIVTKMRMMMVMLSMMRMMTARRLLEIQPSDKQGA